MTDTNDVTTEQQCNVEHSADVEEVITEEDQENCILEMVRRKAKQLGKVYDLDANDGEKTDNADADGNNNHEDPIRVASDSPVERLAYHIVNKIKDDGVAICQAIGPAANQKIDLAVVAALSIISRYQPTATLVVLPCIRKPKMDNGEERTAIRKRIFPIHSKMIM